MTTLINAETGTQYSREELHAAFTAVQNPVNWKLPISAVIAASNKDVTREAIIFFAGCVPTFRIFDAGVDYGPNLVVKAIGYYAAVGA